MICSVCKKNRESVTPKNSDLMPSIRLFLCTECYEGGFEPRYIIILTGRSGDPKVVAPYLKHHRYHGEAITAKELIA